MSSNGLPDRDSGIETVEFIGLAIVQLGMHFPAYTMKSIIAGFTPATFTVRWSFDTRSLNVTEKCKHTLGQFYPETIYIYLHLPTITGVEGSAVHQK